MISYTAENIISATYDIANMFCNNVTRRFYTIGLMKIKVFCDIVRYRKKGVHNVTDRKRCEGIHFYSS